MDLKEERAVGGDPKHHWYYISKARVIKALIGAQAVESVLDVGAGSGVFSQMLIEEGSVGKAVCVDPNYEDEWIGQRDGISYVRRVNTVKAQLVLMTDVIEHVDDDVALIREYAEMAPSGTRFVISVPAFNALWSPHDDFLEHRRRYTLESLRTSVAAAGLEPVTTRYFFGMLFPAVAALRVAARAMKGDREAKKSALKAAPAWFNAGMVAIHDLERQILFPVNGVAGVSAFCVAEKSAKVVQNTRAA